MPRGRGVRTFGDACLRRACRPADPGTPDTARLLDELWEVLSAADGVGLAAPQIGDDRRALVIRDPDRPAGRQRLDVVNPRLVGTSGPVVPFEEGCLSFPGLYFDVRRPRGVRLECLDRDGSPVILEDDGLVARIVQHEMDHLEGRLFIDHLPPWRRWLLAPRLLWIRLGALVHKDRSPV